MILPETSQWDTRVYQIQSGHPFPDLLHTPANAQLYDSVMVVVSQKLGRKCTVPIEFRTQDMWCANPFINTLSARPQLAASLKTKNFITWVQFRNNAAKRFHFFIAILFIFLLTCQCFPMIILIRCIYSCI